MLVSACVCADVAGAASDAPAPAPQTQDREGGQGSSQAPTDDQSAPQSPEDRDKALVRLYDRLAKASDEAEATTIRAGIRQLWTATGSATIDLLLQRDGQAALAHDPTLRRQLLDAASKLSPGTAEIWNRRAGLDYGDLHFDAALADLARVLAIDPRHFEALEALGGILRETGHDALALKALRRLKLVNPTAANLQQEIDDLTRKVEGQKI